MKQSRITKYKKIIAVSLIGAGVLGIGLSLWWYFHPTPSQLITETNSSVNQLPRTGSLYILQRNTTVAISTLELTAELTSHSASSDSVSSVIQFVDSNGTVVQSIKFDQLHQVQPLNGHSVQLQGASVDAVQIVVK